MLIRFPGFAEFFGEPQRDSCNHAQTHFEDLRRNLKGVSKDGFVWGVGCSRPSGFQGFRV